MNHVDIGPEVLLTRDAYGNLIRLKPCPKHPRYKGKGKPRLGPDKCSHCISLWVHLHPGEELR